MHISRIILFDNCVLHKESQAESETSANVSEESAEWAVLSVVVSGVSGGRTGDTESLAQAAGRESA